MANRFRSPRSHAKAGEGAAGLFILDCQTAKASPLGFDRAPSVPSFCFLALTQREGSERRKAHQRSHACEARLAVPARVSGTLASRRSTSGSRESPSAFTQLRAALACPGDQAGPSASTSHRGPSAPRAGPGAAREPG